MKKSIFLFFAAILCAIGVQGAVVTPTGKYFYFKTSSTWNVDNPRYAVYFAWKNGGGEEKTWYSCQKVPGTDIYYAVAPGEFWDIYFCRMNGGNQTNSDANVWNKTDKLQYDGTEKNYWTKSTGWNGTTTYGTYAPPMSSVTLANNGTAINSGSGTEADPYIIEIGTTIKVKAEGTKAVEDPDATINYDFKQGSISKQNGTGTTWTLDATDASTVYTINLDGYTKVNTTSSTKKAATALYFKTVADISIPTYQVSVSINDNTMGSVIGAGEYNENATVTLQAIANDGYRFVNWTVGGVEKETATTYSFTVTEAVEVVANFEVIPTTTVYFVNAEDWAGTINAYAWTDGSPKVENAGWPGVAAHKEDYQIEGHDVYSYTAEEGKYAKVIFNNNSGKQTNDLAWTAGQYICKNQWYATIADVEAALAAPIEYESVYFINTNDWAAVNIYTWTPEVGSWPGVAMTKEAEQIAGKDVYSYTVEKGTTFGGIKFNEGQDKAQTGDLTWQAGKYYAPSTNEWYADAAAAAAALATPAPTYDYYITGTLAGGWDPKQQGLEKDGELYKATFTELNAGEYEFKITAGDWEHQWNYSNLGAAYEEVSQGVDDEGNPNGNIKIVTEEAKNITVIFDATAGKITLEGLTEKVVVISYVLMGVGSDWTTGIALAKSSENANEYVLLQQEILEGDAVKVVTLANGEKSHYCGNVELASVAHEFDKDGNIVLAPGKYDFYYKVAEDIIYIAGEAYPVVPKTITWELNGGELVVEVPTQEELWASFKTAAGLTTLGTLAEITEAGAGKPHNDPNNPCACRIICAKLVDANVNAVFALPEWAWLKAYIMTVQSGLPEASNGSWRYAFAAFFLQSEHSAYPASADFTEAGKPENWGAAYEAAHEVVLPTEPVAEDYVLPTPVKEGYTFVGWYDNAEGTGEPYKVIPAGWAGTLYAIWKQGTTTALENIAVEGKAVKAIINGQLIIIKNGVQYNAQGQVVK